MSVISKILIAKTIFKQLFDMVINLLTLNQDFRTLHIILTDSIELYVINNDHGEYGYNILFSTF